ncbi:DUF5629 family protein [Pseudomonas sp. FIP_A4]|jgi:hypothetical protein|uniref:DUF5629 family protein n=1 Tax=Pseudomonas sp. FIP_A4 TaxID=3070684 RepID=UPI000AA81E18|nr:hypothetical protein FEV13_07320 [Stutzerimonas degradans]QGW19868.1 hypothetical protein GOM96_02300 [Stutzerimonas degradans]
MSDAMTRYLLDELEQADMLEIDGLHAFDFTLDETLLDQADAAAEAGQPFASDDIVVSIEALDGRDRKRWRFSYNSVMEAAYQAEDDSWQLGPHRLKCMGAVQASSEDE